ncbi:hypothetical protein BH23ACT10_BH23ACT10_40560 [soil metagenome]
MHDARGVSGIEPRGELREQIQCVLGVEHLCDTGVVEIHRGHRPPFEHPRLPADGVGVEDVAHA